jgi:hypothetical protein
MNIINNEIPNNLAYEEQDKVKLYTIGWITFATYIGGPLAGCYLMSENFKNVGNEDLAEKTFKIGIISIILLFGSIAFIPESILDKIPDAIIPLTYTAIIYLYVKKFQGKSINEHIENGGLKYSGWRATGFGILSLIVSLLYFFILVMLIPEKIWGG